jgi:hypothetical protein
MIQSRHRHTMEAIFHNPVRADIVWREVEAMLVAFAARR